MNVALVGEIVMCEGGGIRLGEGREVMATRDGAGAFRRSLLRERWFYYQNRKFDQSDSRGLNILLSLLLGRVGGMEVMRKIEAPDVASREGGR